MSDTPRTDKHLHDCFEKDEQGGGWWNYAAMKSREGGDWVPADFARELERENAALRDERDALKDALEYEVVDTQRLHWLLVERPEKDVQP